MGEVSALPAMGSVFFDRREPSRVLRVSWHPETRTYVLSIWRAGECAGTFQLPADAAPDLVHALMLPLVEERADSS